MEEGGGERALQHMTTVIETPNSFGLIHALYLSVGRLQK